MFCTNCGKEIADGSKFCTNCGTKQEIPSQQDTAKIPAQPALSGLLQEAQGIYPINEERLPEKQPGSPNLPPINPTVPPNKYIPPLPPNIPPMASNINENKGSGRSIPKWLIFVPVGIIVIAVISVGTVFLLKKGRDKDEEPKIKNTVKLEEKELEPDEAIKKALEKFKEKASDDIVPGSMENSPVAEADSTADPVIWQGTWTRIGDSYYDSSVLQINELGSGNLEFYFDAYHGANMGMSEGTATAIGNKAVYKNTSEDYSITFELVDGILSVTTGGNFTGVLGAGVSIDGEYQAGEIAKELPTLVDLGVFDNSSQEDGFRELVGEDYELYLNSFQNAMEGEDQDGFGAKVTTGYVSGLKTIMECIVMAAPDNRIWTAIIDGNYVKYYTNTNDTDLVPWTIDTWRNDFSDLEIRFMNSTSGGWYDETWEDDTGDYIDWGEYNEVEYDEEVYDEIYNEEEYGDEPIYSHDYLFSPTPQMQAGEIVFSPREVYYENGELIAVMYIYNGTGSTVFNIDEVELTISDGYDVIAEGLFGYLDGATIVSGDYITWTFRFLVDTVYLQGADLSYLETNSYCTYNY